MYQLAAILADIKISCKDIGNCSSRSPNITEGLSNIVGAAMILVGGLSIVFIIVSGLQMVLSVGDPKRYNQGREGLKYSVIGLVVALLSFMIVKFVTNAV